jgi:TolB-like protein
VSDLFVSYARTDKALVAPLVAALQSQGWDIWWDPAIAPGQEFDRQIATQLESAAAVLVVWTANSVESRWVRGEARDGADRGVLIPVRFGTARLPIDFRAFHTIDLTEDEVSKRGPAFFETLRALEALISRSRSDRGVTQAVPSTPVRSPTAHAAPGAPAKASIAVLPFAAPGGDVDQQLFADGIAEDIIRELARWRSLTVRSRSATFRFRGNDTGSAEVARELAVRYIVEGSLRRMGDRIRISVELIDADIGRQVWAERFDRAKTELFDVQDQVVQQIVSRLVGRVQLSDVERARRKPPASLDAYECVLQGNALPWDDPTAAQQAIALFEKAIELDPDYAIAYALLATMRCGQWRSDDTSDDSLLNQAYALSKRAVDLDDSESTCHSLLAYTCLCRRKFEMALQHMRRSVEVNPNNPWNMADMGLILSYAGLAEEAVGWLQRAREIDPFFDPPWSWRQEGQSYMVLKRFSEALSRFARVKLPNYRVWAYVAACHIRLGADDEARAAASRAVAMFPAFSIARFMTREPFRDVSDAEYLAESLRLAGLPA